jgi:hypothetical protein
MKSTLKFILIVLVVFLVVIALIIATSLKIIPIEIAGPIVFVSIVALWGWWFARVFAHSKKIFAQSGESIKDFSVKSIAYPGSYIGPAIVATLVALYAFYYFIGIGKIISILLLAVYLILLIRQWNTRFERIEKAKTASPEKFKFKNKALVCGFVTFFAASIILQFFLSIVPNVVVSILLGVIVGMIYHTFKRDQIK